MYAHPTAIRFRRLVLIDASLQRPVLPADMLVCSLEKQSLRSFRRYLGTEYHLVYLDMRDGLHADALAALSGTLSAGGVLLLHINMRPAGNTLQRLLQLAQRYSCVSHMTDQNELTRLIKDYQPLVKKEVFQLTDEQLRAYKLLSSLLDESRTSDTHPITRCVGYIEAPRGRGKSTLLGYWVAQLNVRASFCAPSKEQAAQFFRHVGEQPYRFVPPDQLSTWKPQDHEWLIIDEAASLPAYVLEGLLVRAPRLIVASTSEGYEGAGRHFSLRFKHQLQQHYHRVELLTLTQPIRWDLNDPLEGLMNATFCMHRRPASNTTTDALDDLSNQTLSIRICKPSDLTTDEFSEIFELLMEAHYQSSPNDVRMLLEDEQQQLFLGYHNHALICACWLHQETILSSELSEAILRGERRIPGHLISQSIGYHLREGLLMRNSFLRIVRVVVSPRQQRKGIGSEFLRRIMSDVASSKCFALGTSFGAHPDLIRFWERQGFSLIRLSHKADAASGYPSVLMLAPIAPGARSEVQRLHEKFQLLLPFQAVKQPEHSLGPLKVAKSLTSREHEILKKDYPKLHEAFVAGWIPFATAQPTIAAFVHFQRRPTHEPLPPILHAALFTESSLQALARPFGLSGKKEVEQRLREICAQSRLGL